LDKGFIICWPAKSISEIIHVIPLSVIRKASCGHDVWLSPAGIKLREQGLSLVCMACAPSDIDHIEITEEVRKEASAFLGRYISPKEAQEFGKRLLRRIGKNYAEAKENA